MTTEPTWTAVDEYFTARLGLSDPALDHALTSSVAAGLPEIAVTASQGMLLQMLARLCNARRILEIGTLGGYSTIWMARALPPGGRLATLEISATNAAVAQQNLEYAGVADRVNIMVAPASESLAQLAAEKGEPFDLVFIDADKKSSDDYFKAALQLSRPGTVIVVDNVVRDGAVIDETDTSDDLHGIRAMVDSIRGEKRVTATAIQTVGSKGYDGLVIALVQ